MNATPAAEPGTGARGALQALLVLLPVFALAWPFEGAILAQDLTPRATGFGAALLFSLPAAALLFVRGAAPSFRGFLLLAAPLVAAALWLGLGAPSDTHEAGRALLGWTLVAAVALMGASLGADGARVLARGAVLAALACSLGAIAAPHAGALGNAGATSEAATLGAAAGVVLVWRDRFVWRVAGLLAIGAFLVHALLAPVLAGAVALCAAAAVVGVAARGRARALVWILAALAAACALAPFALHRPAQPADTGTVAAIEASPAAGGGVRALLLASSLRMLAAHPLAGVGPGQFPAAFPPYRDPREIEISSHGRASAVETEVEHAHDDWLQPALEGGVIVGIAWIGFLIVLLIAAWRALRTADPAHAALGAGVIALCLHALARAPFTANAASAVLFAAAAGALLARPADPGARWSRRAVALAAVVSLAVLSPRALDLVRHGFAFQGLAHAERDPEALERSVRGALAAAPDSVQALSLEANVAEIHGEPPALVAERWRGVLARRPHRIEARVQLATALVLDGRAGEARAHLEHALALDPANPAALRNLATLLLRAGELPTGLALLDRIPAAAAPTPEWLRGLAARLSLAGLEAESEALFARSGAEFAERTPEQCYALSRAALAAGDDELADGWEARAQRGWAGQHARAGRFADAVRSLRQDLRLCTERPGPAPVRVRLALAAALDGAGRGEEARAELAALEFTARDVAALPAWAREHLRSAGLLP